MLIKTFTSSFKKMHLKMLSVKCQSFCSNVLIKIWLVLQWHTPHHLIIFLNSRIVYIVCRSTYDILPFWSWKWNILLQLGQYHGCWYSGCLSSQAISIYVEHYAGRMGGCLTWQWIHTIYAMSVVRYQRKCRYLFVSWNRFNMIRLVLQQYVCRTISTPHNHNWLSPS